ncbi:hypothetical protein D9M70_591170 [compost metagenome]
MFGRRQVQAGQAILGTIHGVTLHSQIVGHIGQDVPIVFNQQNAHSTFLRNSLA